MRQRNYLDNILSIDYKGTARKDITQFITDKNYFKETKFNKIIMYLFEGLILK
jgi:hypothetical protein